MKKILVIDDSKTVRTLCEWIYKGVDDKLFTAASAAEGEKIIAAESPDVVFVDYTLPDGNAIDFIQKHKSANRAMILLGGTYVDCDVDAAMAAGAFECLIKPFKTDVYFDLVDKAYASLHGSNADKNAESVDKAYASLQGGSHDPNDVTMPQHVATISTSAPAIPRSNSGLAAVPRTNSGISVPPISGAPKRFNFPSQQSSAVARPNTPPVIDNPSVVGADNRVGCTPKTPVPSVTPEVAALASAVISSTTFHDELKNAIQEELTDFINQAVVAEFKKGVNSEVNAYFTNSIMPQLQKWIDARVVAIVRKMTGK